MPLSTAADVAFFVESTVACTVLEILSIKNKNSKVYGRVSYLENKQKYLCYLPLAVPTNVVP